MSSPDAINVVDVGQRHLDDLDVALLLAMARRWHGLELPGQVEQRHLVAETGAVEHRPEEPDSPGPHTHLFLELAPSRRFGCFALDVARPGGNLEQGAVHGAPVLADEEDGVARR